MGATQSTTQPCILKTPKGSLKGLELSDKAGNPVYRRYVKIPYAQPPLGKLRWRRPQPLPLNFTFDSTSSTPGDYTSFGPICPQPVYTHSDALIENPDAAPPIENVQDEDCLYLNIWVPSGPPPGKGWPVQMFLHGGWLQMGDAMQDNTDDPFDLFSSVSLPRIIISPTYRLNLFGFLTGPPLAATGEDRTPGNYGFWDQRAALEWTSENISLFGGDPSNISLGGLSAGANSAFFQLHYDTFLPPHKRLIKRIYLHSNAVGIQPPSPTSPTITSQFDSLCTAFSIPISLPPAEIITRLRAVPAPDLVAVIAKIPYHTFRGSTDADFIPSSFLASIHSGAFTTALARNNISILLGEVAHESRLYRLVNPPSDLKGLQLQLKNYYPGPVVDALLASGHYALPDNGTADEWADIYSQIVADCQVHAVVRGFTHSLLSPPTSPDVTPLSPSQLHRYRIAWRSKSMDKWIQPAVGVCHAADMPLWFASGFRAGYTKEEKQLAREWLEPFKRFLYGEEEIGWGAVGERMIRVLNADGTIEVREDDGGLWEGGLRVCGAIWEAQKGGEV